MTEEECKLCYTCEKECNVCYACEKYGGSDCRLCFTCEKEGSLRCGICVSCEKEGLPGSACRFCYTCEKEGEGKQPTPRRQPRRRPRQPMGRPQWSGKGSPMDIWVSSCTVFPTNLCNLRCKYCFIYEYERKFGDNMTMSVDTAKRLIQWLAVVSGPNKEIGIHWFGGEPLVGYSLMEEITPWAEEWIKGTNKRIKWGLTSNMTLISDEVNEFLKKYNYYVLVSIDGLSPSHDKHRIYADGSGSWKDAIKGLDRILQWRKDPPTIRWTISPTTIDGIVNGTKFFVEKKKCPIIAHELVYEAEWSEEHIAKLEKEMGRLVPYIVNRFNKDGTKLEFKMFRDGLRVFTLKQRMSDRCGLARGDVGIDVDGNVFRCHRFVDQYDHYLGNIWTGLDYNKMREINTSWSHDKIIPWNGDLNECKNCPSILACNGGCLAVNYDMTGNVYQVPKSFCDLLHLKTRLADKLRKALMKAKLWDKWIAQGSVFRRPSRCVE